jgi:oxygen-independent coproporphyrinogen-3 oxidase
MTIPQGFLRHAARNLPRYASYPTALALAPVENDSVARAAFAAIAPGTPLSFYVHVPFCDRLCWYCGCHTGLPNGYERVAAYVERALAEIDLWADIVSHAGPIAHLHFGGGSPNALSPADFLRLMDALGALGAAVAGGQGWVFAALTVLVLLWRTPLRPAPDPPHA